MKLTNREFEVLSLVAAQVSYEMPTAEAARRLGTSRANAQTYLTRLRNMGFFFHTFRDRENCRNLLASGAATAPGPLNERQLAILKLYAKGHTYREIACVLSQERMAKGKKGCVQVGTVTQYLCHIFSVLGGDFKHKRGDARIKAARRWLLAKDHFTAEEMATELPNIPAKSMRLIGNGLTRKLYVVYGIYEGNRLVYIGSTPHPRDRMNAHRDFFPNATAMELMHGSHDPEEIWQKMDEEIARHSPRDNNPDFTAYANSSAHAMPPRQMPVSSEPETLADY